MTEHVELFLVPAADDVEPGAAAADVVDRHQRLGREHRMDQRNVHGRKDRDVPGDCGHRRGVRQGFERRGAHLCFAAVALPARDRKNELDAGLVGDPRQRFRSRSTRPASDLRTLVKAVPPSALIENSPSLKRFAFLIGLIARADICAVPILGERNTMARKRPISIAPACRDAGPEYKGCAAATPGAC